MLNQKTVNGVGMTPTETKFIRETWDMVVPIADDAARMFYQRLFEIDPGTKALFDNTDMAQQRDKLLKALGLVVENADKPEGLTPVLEEMGRSHVRYGVEDRHYDSVGAALLWTLEQGLGEAFTEAVRSAWTNLYAAVSGPMRHAAAEMAAAASRRSPLRNTAVAICLTLGMAGGLAAVSLPIATPPVQAFGFGDVWDGAKKVGGVVKDSAKAVRDIDKAAREAVRDATLDATSKVSGEFVRRSNEVYYKARGEWNEENKKSVENGIRQADGWIKGAGGLPDRGKSAVKDTARKAREEAMTGKLTPVQPDRQRYQPGQWGQQGKAANRLTTKQNRALTGKAPVQGITRQNLQPGKGQTAKITLQKGPVGNDRSIWGRPVGQTKKAPAPRSAKKVPAHRGSKTPDARRRDYPNYPPKKPTYPGYPGNKGASGLTKQGSVARDRSRMGRPAGITKANVKPQQKGKRIVRERRTNDAVRRDHRSRSRDISRNSNRKQNHPVQKQRNRGRRG